MKKKIRSEQDLMKIMNLISSEYDCDGMWIKIPLPSYNLKRLDEYMFQKFNPNQKYNNEKVPNEEVYVKMGDVQFQLVGDGNYEKKIKKDEYGDSYIEV
jgi:hypothetical protein